MLTGVIMLTGILPFPVHVVVHTCCTQITLFSMSMLDGGGIVTRMTSSFIMS